MKKRWNERTKPLFVVYYILETIYNWNRDKDMAAISILMTIVISAISCAVFFYEIKRDNYEDSIY